MLKAKKVASKTKKPIKEDYSHLPIKIGLTVSDQISGFTGTVTTKHELISGMIQYGITPKGKTAIEFPESRIIDPHNLTVIGLELLDRVTPPPVNDSISLGDTVVNVVNKVQGIVVERVTSFNGCVQYLIEQTANKPDKSPKKYLVPYNLLETIDSAVRHLIKVPEQTRKSIPTGGPSRSMSSLVD